jgi:hypothetical protein
MLAACSPQAEARRDYELALQIGNKDALNAFLAQYPDGYYANLARIQLARIAAEETRIAATEKARLAEQKRAAAETPAADKAPQNNAAADKAAAVPPAAEKAQGEKQGMNLASLGTAPPQDEIVRSVQIEARLDCFVAFAPRNDEGWPVRPYSTASCLFRRSVTSIKPGAWVMANGSFAAAITACGVTPQAQNTGISSASTGTASP